MKQSEVSYSNARSNHGLAQATAFAGYPNKGVKSESSIGEPITLTLPPRLAATARWQAFVAEQTPAQFALEYLAEAVADIAGVVHESTTSTEEVVKWLLEVSEDANENADAALPRKVTCEFSPAQFKRLSDAAQLLSRKGVSVSVKELVITGALSGLDWPNDPAAHSVPVLNDLVETYARNGATFADPEYGTNHPLQANGANRPRKSSARANGGAS